ncbi:MAG: hypothetical protein DRP47_08195 [Candidatus Zixiibacteriota bacterium]|nr:MAG: hypothetical protein DRP47_08195 [candidate division Zixibacteria bacterium]
MRGIIDERQRYKLRLRAYFLIAFSFILAIVEHLFLDSYESNKIKEVVVVVSSLSLAGGLIWLAVIRLRPPMTGGFIYDGSPDDFRFVFIADKIRHRKLRFRAFYIFLAGLVLTWSIVFLDPEQYILYGMYVSLAGTLCFLVGLVWWVTLLFYTPKKKGIKGTCPYCNTRITADLELPAITCPGCLKRLLIRNYRFVTIEEIKES